MKLKNILLVICCVLTNWCVSSAQTKISILGDSYSTFKGYVYPSTNACWYGTEKKGQDQAQNNVSKLEETWWMLLTKKLDAQIEYNNSYSGATICHRGYSDRDFADRSFVTRMYNLGNPDIILIIGGTNDAWSGAPLGKYQYENWTNENLYQFSPAFGYLLSHIKVLYPKARILNVSNCGLRQEFLQSMDEICKHYDVPNIRLEDIDKQGGHPSIKGMQMICDQIYAHLK